MFTFENHLQHRKLVNIEHVGMHYPPHYASQYSMKRYLEIRGQERNTIMSGIIIIN